MDEQKAKSIEKIRTFVNHILEQCETKGLTLAEARMIPGELGREIERTVEESLRTEVFFKRV